MGSRLGSVRSSHACVAEPIVKWYRMTTDQIVVWLLMVFTSVMFVVRSPVRIVVRLFSGVLIGAYLILFVTFFARIFMH